MIMNKANSLMLPEPGLRALWKSIGDPLGFPSREAQGKTLQGAKS